MTNRENERSASSAFTLAAFSKSFGMDTEKVTLRWSGPFGLWFLLMEGTYQKLLFAQDLFSDLSKKEQFTIGGWAKIVLRGSGIHAEKHIKSGNETSFATKSLTPQVPDGLPLHPCVDTQHQGSADGGELIENHCVFWKCIASRLQNAPAESQP